jgi:cobalt-zinc-cadmium efflux system protein
MYNHNHSHPNTGKGDRKQNILFAAILNICFVFVEIVAGILTNSIAILSDALHDFGDSFALLSSYFIEKKAEKQKDSKRTFGYARLSLFSAILNATILIAGSTYILYEALQRFWTPEPVSGLGMMLVAVVGVAINSVAYFRLSQGQSANEKVLSWHLLEDVLGWAATLVAGVIIYFTDIYLVDTILTIGYTLFILFGVTRNLKNVVNLLMQGVPTNVNVEEVESKIRKIVNVLDVHDIHIWSLDGEKAVFTAHITILNWNINVLSVKEQVKDVLHHSNIEHSTIEYETKEECETGHCKF